MRSFSLPAVGPAPFLHCAASPDPLPWCSASPKDTAVLLFQWKAKENVAGEREGAPAVGGLFVLVSKQNPINPWALPMTSPLHWTSSLYIHPPAQDQKVEKNKERIKCSLMTLQNAYTKSADEKYLYCGDDTAQEQTLSSPNTNK